MTNTQCMAKQRKSRKVGLIGVRKDPDYVHEKSSGRVKKHKGKAPGSRHNVDTKNAQASSGAKSKDPRHGSKKPIQLVKSPVKPAQRKYATPAEELAALEADSRLSALLDKLDEGNTLTAEQQYYVDEKMARHRILCDLMGIRDEEDDDDDDTDDFDKLDSINIDDYTR